MLQYVAIIMNEINPVITQTLSFAKNCAHTLSK